VRALVVGASGQVGGGLMQALRARGHEATGTYTAHAVSDAWPLDLRNTDAVEHAVHFVKPDWIFCPAGLSHVDYCEDHAEEAFALNRDAPLFLGRMAQRAGAAFVYYSSDYVFDGNGGPFGEEDEPRPLNVYGRSKLEAERAILAAIPRALVLRTSVVYGPEPQQKNFVYQLIRACRGGHGFRPAVDQRASPSYNVDVATATVECCEREERGIWHLAGADTLDRMAFSRLVCRVFDLDGSRLTPATTAELGQKAGRPLDGGLDVGKARRLLKTPLRGAEEGLRAMRTALDAGPVTD
jgi:dTDP-4-dehydrorhamnose reductase